MKLQLIVAILITIHCAQCHHISRTKRSSQVLEYFSNKTSSLITKGKALTTSTFKRAGNAISSITDYFSRNGKSIKEEDLTVQEKVKFYINQAHNAANTVFDNIAPEQTDYECSDEDPANHMTALQLITIHGYYAEAHTVLTEDGYLLTIHRIPYSKNHKKVSSKTILLHHGFLGSSIDWVIPGARRSLPYLLSDAGYDVWMANVRGNTYSRAHIFRPVESAAFWNFTFNEIAQYDLPAVIDYIREHKGGNEKIDYIGFSMGTTVLFAMLSMKPQYNAILKGGYTLAPVAYMTEIKSPFKILAKYGNTINAFFKLVGANEFLPRNAVIRYLSKHSCKVEDFEEAFCEITMFLMCGHDNKHFDRSLMPMILGHVPAGASTKTLAHFAQEIRNNGTFQHFDYGEEGNMVQYGTTTPPEYPLDKITLPIVMISAEDDWLSSVADAKLLLNKLRTAEHHVVEDKKFNHLDFMFAKDAHILVYEKLLSMLRKRETNFVLETNEIK